MNDITVNYKYSNKGILEKAIIRFAANSCARSHFKDIARRFNS